MKKYKKRMIVFFYYLQNNNKVSDLMFSLMIAIDFSVILILPFEIIFDFQKNEVGNYEDYIEFNYFFGLERRRMLLYITDGINAYLFILASIILFYFLKNDFSYSSMKSNQSMILSVLSFSILLTGRFLAFAFLAFQIIAIRCKFMTSICYEQTDSARLYINSIGIILNFAIGYLQYISQNLIFPQQNIPWAQPQNKYRILNRFILLLAVFEIVFMDYLPGSVAFYILLLPLIFLQTIQLWIVMFNRVAFNNIAQYSATIKDSIIWAFLFVAILIDIGEDESDFTYSMLLIIAFVSIFGIVHTFKQQIAQRNFKMLRQLLKNEKDQLNVIFTCLEYQQAQIGSVQEVELSYFYYQHIWICQDFQCPCKEDAKKNDSNDQNNQKSLIKDKKEMNQSMIFENVRSIDLKDYEEDLKQSAINNKFAFGKYQIGFNRQQDDMKLEWLSQKRNKLLLRIIFHMCKSTIIQKSTQFLEIFIKAYQYSSVYQSLYDLLQLKSKCHSSEERQIYAYLNIFIFQKIKLIEEESKREMFDIDKAIIVERNFQDYKKFIYETTILVEKFWMNLKRTDFIMAELLLIGKSIVDNYLTIKDIYEEVIEQQPGFREIVVLHLQFIQNALNFEIEAIQLQNYIKNLDQKLKITRQNQYHLEEKIDNGIIIVQQKPNKRNKIMIANKKILEMLGYTQSDLIKKDIGILIPEIIQVIHDKLIENFLQNEKNQISSNLRRVWIKNSESHIIPVQIVIDTCVSEHKGLLLVAFIQQIKQIVKQNFQSKIEDCYFLIADEAGYVINSSQNFAEEFLGNNVYLQDSKLNIEELFVGVNNFSEQELKDGVKTQMISNFIKVNVGNDYAKAKKMKGILLSILNLKITNEVSIKEVIFTIDKTLDSERESRAKSKKIQINDVDSVKKQQQYIENFHNHHSESSDSSYSASMKSNELLQTKQILDFQSMPQSILNIKRSMIIFFIILMATSFSVLAVSLVSNNQFRNDQESVQQSIYMLGQLANLRLSFKMLIQTNYLPKTVQLYTFNELQSILAIYFDGLKYYQNKLIDDEYSAESELNVEMKQNVLQLSELQNDGSISEFNTTFTIGMYQFLTKMETFLEMPQQKFMEELRTFRITDKMINQTQIQKNAWFLIYNGNKNVRSLSMKVGDLYISEGQNKEGKYTMTVLIISITCIAVTILASSIFIPVTFALDNEENEIVSYWLIISELTKDEVLHNITEFSTQFQNETINENQIKKKAHYQIQNTGQFETLSFTNMQDYRTALSNISSQALTRQNFTIQLQEGINKININQEKMNFSEDDSIGIKTLKEIKTKNLTINAALNYQSDFKNISKASNIQESSHNLASGSDLFDQSQISIQNQTQKTLNAQTYHTTLDRTHILNETQDEILQSKMQKQSQANELRRIFLVQKLKKALIILSFSSIIIGFYLASFFICENIFYEASQSFNYQKVVSRRGPCLTNSYTYLMETFSQNKTQYIGESLQTLQDYVMVTCADFEQIYLSYIKNPPHQIENIEADLKKIDGPNVCSDSFDNYKTILGCETFMNGLMKTGLRSSLQSTYFYLLNQLVKFQGTNQINRTRQFLDSLEFDPLLQKYLKLILDYQVHISDRIRQMIDDEIARYLNYKVQQYLIIFSFFIIFLIASLFVALRFIIEALKKVVFRSRILIKIIPTDELKRINSTIKNKKYK